MPDDSEKSSGIYIFQVNFEQLTSAVLRTLIKKIRIRQLLRTSHRKHNQLPQH